MRIILISVVLGIAMQLNAQTRDHFLSDSLYKDLAFLSSDSLKGRKSLSPEIRVAAKYISDIFQNIGLRKINKGGTYYSPFQLGNPIRQDLIINGDLIPVSQYYAFNKNDIAPSLTEKDLNIHRLSASTPKQLYDDVLSILAEGTPALVQLSGEASKHMDLFEDSSYAIMEKNRSYLIVYPGTEDIRTVQVKLSAQAEASLAHNIIGVLPGRSLPAEYVIISAHYDHVGTYRSRRGDIDSIYNGANDNASGVTAMLAFARHFVAKNNNARTIIFIAFAAEELGLVGSKHLSERMDISKIKAVLNLEMLGKPNEPDPHLTITGDEYSDLYEITKRYSKGLKIQRDRYPEQRLHWRSDHFPFFEKEVVAHTYMYFSPDDSDYHGPSDEIGTLNIPNLSQILKQLLPTFEAIINGVETPILKKR